MENLLKHAVVVDDGDIEGTITQTVNSELNQHCRMENSGIGAYEYSGHREYDAGQDYAVLDSYHLALDITGQPELNDFNENVKGHGTHVLGDVWEKHPDISSEVEWKAIFEHLVMRDGKTYLIFQVVSE